MKNCKICSSSPADAVGNTYCKPCDAERVRESRRQNPLRWILTRIKMNAKNRGIPCSLKLSDFPRIPKYCPVFPWIKLIYAVGSGQVPGSLSVDRIDNNLGYEPGNIAFMSFRANSLKGDASLKELISLGEFGRKHLTKKPI